MQNPISTRLILISAFLLSACGSANKADPQQPCWPKVDKEVNELNRLGEQPSGTPAPCTSSKNDVAMFETRCLSRSPDDCNRAGFSYGRGCGVVADSARALWFFEKGCEQGSLVGCDMQALVMLDHSGRTADALNLLERTCVNGGGLACGNWGLALTSRLKTSTAVQIEKGLTLMHLACSNGYPAFCSRFLTVIAAGKHTEWFDLARSANGQACNKGYLDACNELAIALEDGTLGLQNFSLAANLGNFACQRGHMPSCNTVGYMLVAGHGFDKNTKAASDLFHYACTQGYAPACDSAAESAEKGWGGPADKAKAEELYRYACVQGSTHACKRVGMQLPE